MEQSNPQKKRKRLTCAFQKGFARQYHCLVRIKSYPPGYSDELHNHDYPQVWYCLSGTYTHQVGDQVYKCTKGSVILVPSGVFHGFWISDNESAELVEQSVMYDIFLDTPIDRYQNAAANLFLPPFAAELGISFPAYRMFSQESQAAFEAHISWFASLIFNLHNVTPNVQIYEKLEAIFSLPEFALPEEYREKAAWLVQLRLRPMLRVLAYLNLHYPEKIVEKDLLQVAAVCRTDLYQYFKCLTGYSCFDYLRWLRICHAADYMTNTTYSLSYISDICGFSNPPHMSRIFRNYTGITPRAYRKSVRPT